MTRKADPTSHRGRGGAHVAGAGLWAPAWVLLAFGLSANAQNLTGTLTSGTYSASGALTNCSGVGPPPTGCVPATLGTNANVVLTATSQIVLGPGFTASAANASTSLVASIATPVITTNEPLPSGTTGSTYSSQTLSAAGGTSPYTWSASGLPIGLSLSSGGVLSGTPVVAGNQTVAVTVTDADGKTETVYLSITDGTNSSTIHHPSALQANLSFMSFGYYDASHTASSYGFTTGCPSGSSVRGCFQQVLANLRAQGVSGVRIFVGLCEDDTTISPLTNCGETTGSVTFSATSGPGLTWVTNAGSFFQDVASAGIENVTITLADTAQEYYSSYPTRLTLPEASTSSPGGGYCSDTTDPVQFSPTYPFGLNYNTLYPIGQDQPNSNGYNCAPINPYFVGWSNEFSAVNALLGAAHGKVNVYEFEPEQEINMVDFTADLRYVDDNSSGSFVDVYGQFATLMSNNGFDPRRVTYSAATADSSSPTGNCTNVYTDYSRQFGLDAVVAAIAAGGAYVGVSGANGGIYPYLWCGGTTSGMIQAHFSHSLPDILDSHTYPSSLAGTTDAYVQSVADLDYSDLFHLFALLALNPQSTQMVIGETYSGSWASSCSPSPYDWNSSAPSENVAGFNESQLAENPIVLRPWLELEDPTGTCYPYSSDQNINGGGDGPYTPTQQ